MHCYNQVVSAPDRRGIILHQKRHVRDFPIDGNTVAQFRKSSAADFIMVGHSDVSDIPYFDSKLSHIADTQGALCGWMFVIPNDIVKQRRRQAKRLVSAIVEHEIASDIQSIDLLSNALKRLDESRENGLAILAIKFVMFRTGEVRVWFDSAEFFGGSKSGNSDGLDDVLPSHCYHFLKDITHRHYHHNDDSDQLIQLTKVKKVKNSIDDVSWRRNTLWGLARVSLQYRHKDKIADYKRAQGILAYAEAFQTTLAKIARANTVSAGHTMSKIALYDFQQIKESMQAVESVATWRSSAWTQFVATIFAICRYDIRCFSIMLCFLGGKPSSYIENLFN